MFPASKPPMGGGPSAKSLSSVRRTIGSLPADPPKPGADPTGDDGSVGHVACPNCGAPLDLKVAPSADAGDQNQDAGAGAPIPAQGAPGGGGY